MNFFQKLFSKKKKPVSNNKNDFQTKNREHYTRVTNQASNAPVDDGFVESVIAGFATNSVGLGTVIGGNPLGAFIGEELNNIENQQSQQVDFDGGASGGGGAGGQWNDTPVVPNDTQDDNQQQENYQPDNTPDIPDSSSSMDFPSNDN